MWQIDSPVNPKDVRKLEAVEVEGEDPACGSGTVPCEEYHVREDGEPVARSHVVPQNRVDLFDAVDQRDVGERGLQGILCAVQHVYPAPPALFLYQIQQP